jgi:hypothetical protein
MVSPVLVSPTERRKLKAGSTPGLASSGIKPKLPFHLPIQPEAPLTPSNTLSEEATETISELPKNQNATTDKAAGRPKYRKGYSKLSLRALESVQSIKDSLHAMRGDRSTKRKVRFADRDEDIGARIPQSRSSESFLAENMASFTSLRSNASFTSSASLGNRVKGVGEITLSDLDLRFFHKEEEKRQLIQHEIGIVALQKEISAVKKDIKQASKDVWIEKEELVALQQKNWSLRKSLIRTPAPENSVTALNYKLEKLTRKDRQIEEDIDRISRERIDMDEECYQMTKAIQNMKLLMDGLHQKVVPLLSTSIGHQPSHDSRGSRFSTIDPASIKDNEMDDTMHSMD